MCVCVFKGEGQCGDRAHVFGALLTNSLPSITASPPGPPQPWQLGHPGEAGMRVPKGSQASGRAVETHVCLAGLGLAPH